MKEPLFVIEGLDVEAYASADAIGRDIEPFFLEKADYRAYDAEGRLMTLGTKYREMALIFGILKRDIEYVVVQSAEEEPSHQQELQDALRMNLSYRFKEKEPEYKTMSLEELVGRFIESRKLFK